MDKFKLVIVCLALGACTNAGPFVSNISSDGDGGILVEKCAVHMNAFMGTISNNSCATQRIKLK